jgi:hypothetical protein
MENYDPMNASTPITDLAQPDEKKTVPTGLLRVEKNVEENQMAEFSSSIEEMMPGPGQMMQDEVMGPPRMAQGNRPTARSESSGPKKNPFGLTDEQYFAVMAGVAAVIAYSAPVQDKLSTTIPNFLNEAGKQSLSGMAATALVAAIIFYFVRKFLTDKA